MRLKLGRLAEWAEGQLVQADPETEVTGVSTDSRTLRPGDLFVAIEGPRFDGHDFAAAAMGRGAAGAVVSRAEALAERPGIVVENTVSALGKIAHRSRWDEPLVPWVGITGSNGKTTTREILAQILRVRGPVASPRENYNNLIGLPLTVLRRADDIWAGVLELGTNGRGEVARLVRIATPTIGIVTSVGPAHLEGLHDLETVAHEKASIFDCLPPDGLAIFPADDPHRDILRTHIRGVSASFGLNENADLWAERIETDEKGVRFSVQGTAFFLPLLGVHNVLNALAALLAARHLGIPLEAAVEPMAHMRPIRQRLEAIRTEHLVILNDAYNANPGSLRVAVETLVTLDAPRRIVIVGDMKELGEQTRELHREAGRLLATMGLDVIVAVGTETLALAEVAENACARCVVRHYRSVPALLRSLGRHLRAGDCVLVKGSRAMGMEKIVEGLRKWRPRGSERRRT